VKAVTLTDNRVLIDIGETLC